MNNSMQRWGIRLWRLTMAFWVGTVLLLAFTRCANTIPPQGGPKDETPPQLDTLESTPNYLVNFEKQPIVFEFDEWVELDDYTNEIVISPPLDPQDFEVRIRKKSVIFEFTETAELRENATYTINFGESIKDLTEGNAADYLRYVFSTGDQLDSLEMSGIVVDAQTGEPVEDVLFMLYENLADSVVRTERPFYFGKTNAAGRFIIRNIKEGTFKGFALQDKQTGNRYIYDESELIGFPDSLIVLREGSPAPDVTVRLFQEAEIPNPPEEELDEFGAAKLVYKQSPETFEVRTPDGPEIFTDFKADTLIVWYAEEQAESWSLIVRKDTVYQDTFYVPAIEAEEFLRSARLTQTGSSGSKLAPGNSYTVQFNHPLGNVDTTFIRLTEDTTKQIVYPSLTIDTSNRKELLVQHRWTPTVPYELTLLPGAVYDIFGIPNQDTIVQEWRVQGAKDVGNLVLNVNQLDSAQQYVIQITRGEDVIREEIVQGAASFEKRFTNVPPGEYIVRIITDWNRNGKWDTGDYSLNRQPEPIRLQKLEQLRANWDLEATVSLE